MNAKTSGGRTALMHAAGDLVSPPGSPQYVSSGNPAKNYNHDGVVNALLAAGADVNASNEDGRTALMLAAAAGRAAAVKSLLRGGANVSAQDKDGKTALMLATKFARTEVVKLLKQAGVTK